MLILSLPQIINLWGLHPFQNNKTKSDLKIVTYNVRNFDLYNWSKNEASGKKIFDKLSEINPDIICFQEFYSQPNSKWNNIETLKRELGFPHYYFTRELVLNNGRQWGIATFSKYPIIRYKELIKSSTSNRYNVFPNKGIYTDIALEKDTVRVINVHLASIYLGREDYNTIENISEPSDITMEESKSIILKLLKAYSRRGNQVKQLREFLDSEQPHPLIICGDYNDLPTSYAYNQISKNMQDAFLNKGWGPGATYNGPLPAMRIDNILVDKSLQIQSIEIIKLDISDHWPMVAEIDLD